MNRYITLILALLLTVSMQAQKRISREYNNVSLSDALNQLAEQQTGYTIYFLYNELEDFRITTTVKNKHLPEAIQQMIGFYPIRVTTSTDEDGRKIFVECIQKTETRYKGSIIDETGQPVAYANVYLLHPSDSTLISGGVSNEAGLFVIPCETNPVLARISYVGYKTIYKICDQPEVGTIRLHADNYALKGVTVTGNAIQNTSSGYKVNFKALQYAKDRMLTDVLPFLPGISIKDEKITILGNSITSYYIDGNKMTDPAVLKSLPSDRIESIEVDYLAGADESGSAVGGIIRITTRREFNGGFSGDIKGAITLQPKNGISNKTISNTLSASLGKLYLFNSISLDHNTPVIHEAETFTANDKNESNYATDRSGKWKRSYINEYLGLSYEISTTQQLKGSVWYSFTDQDISDDAETRQGQGMNTSIRENSIRRHTIQGVAGYVWKPKPGHQLDFMIDYLYRNQHDRQHTVIDCLQPTSTSQVQNTRMLRVQPKWQQPLSKSLMLTAGLDYQQTIYDNDLDLQTKMTSHVPAAFARLQGRSKVFQYEVGLRVQHTNMQVDVADVKNEHNVFGIYPTVNLMWMINPKRQHMLNLMYKYSMEDLPYSVISTYRYYTSPYSYETGNPELKSPKGHQLMLMAKLWGKWTLMGGIMRSNDEIYFVREQSPESPSVTQTKPYNCAYVEGVMLGMEYLLQVGNVWTGKPRIQLIKVSGEVLGTHYSNPASLTFDWNNDFRFSPTFSGGLTFHYEPTAHFLDNTLERVYHVTLNMTKSLCHDRLLIGLRAKPIVKNRRSITEHSSVRMTYHNLTKEQNLELSVTWRFKGGKHLKEQSTANSLQNYRQFEKEQ
ncbi:MAG: outer membrane beta-barrel protein [Prevotella sp.]|nr:outer membrane beta-barrel protein [Prevotella sp.]